jgi:hypothetical protein
MQDIGGSLRVGVIHGPGRTMKPVWFDLKNRKHTIQDVTNIWRDRQGGTVRIHFFVTDEGALYELIYNLNETSWTLQTIEIL